MSIPLTVDLCYEVVSPHCATITPSNCRYLIDAFPQQNYYIMITTQVHEHLDTYAETANKLVLRNN